MKKTFLIPVILAGVFLFCGGVKAANTDVVINEIVAYETRDHEWIDIFNKGSDPVDITGWKFFENSTNHGLILYQGADMIIESG